MLEIRHLSVSYGQHRALEDVSLKIGKGEIAVILGANGAGKSTLLRAISGICEGQVAGQIDIDGHPLLGLSPDRIVEAGVALVPEGRGIFGDLTVRENLILGAYANRAREDEAANLERVLSLFPKLGERQGQIARTMSGGEQQMVAIGRAMMSNPQILMLDEPSLGLSPLLCKELFASLAQVRRTGIGILLVEQNAKQSLAIADRGYLLENARIVHEDRADSLSRDPAVQKAYLGAGSGGTSRKASKAPEVEAGPPATAPADVPLARNISPHTPPRVTADQLLGQSVSALVSRAAAQTDARHAVAPASTGRPISPASTGASSDHDARLKAMLKDMERAAAAARRPGDRAAPVTMKPAPSQPEAPAVQPPVVVEVYRAPRVEVYRRRKGGTEFERD